MRSYSHHLTHAFCGNYATAKALTDELVALADEKGASFWKAHGMTQPRLLIGPDRQSRRRRPHDHLRAIDLPVNRSNRVHAVGTCQLWRGPMRNSANSMTLGAALREAMTAVETTKETVVRGRGPSHCRRNRAASRRARCDEGGSVFRACARGRPSATSKVLGTPRRNEHGAALARPGQGAASARTARSGLRVVH